MTALPKFSIYMPVVNGYTITKITLDSLLRNMGFEFNKFIIISSGTTDQLLLDLLKTISEKGYGYYPKEKFHVLIFPESVALGWAESFNLAIALLEDGEDLFYTPNNAYFSRNFMIPLIEHAYFRPHSEDVYVVTSMSPLLGNEQLNEQYNREIRHFLMWAIGPEQALILIEDFFKRHTENKKDFEETCQYLKAQYHDQISASGPPDNSMYIKHECFDRVGYFDERFARDSSGAVGGGSEETDYMFRIYAQHKAILKVGNSFVLHLAYGFTSRSSVQREILTNENNDKFAKKYDTNSDMSIKTPYGFKWNIKKVLDPITKIGKINLTLSHKAFDLRHVIAKNLMVLTGLKDFIHTDVTAIEDVEKLAHLTKIKSVLTDLLGQTDLLLPVNFS